MTNEPNQPFNIEEWLAIQKKGFGGKISREVFIAKMKDLGQEIEQLKKNQTALETKNKKLEEQSTIAQSDLTSRDQIITQTQNKLTEQEKILQSKEEQLQRNLLVLQDKDNELQKRPDITKEKFQELVNNQEKHSDQDLKPNNLPAD
ncbi:14275_t:CDS:1 [Funneliformis geosporum]|uniref:17844_t:CDS:1 n=1 Tax=Funneliformis geosporum TaxID=1117311 RepID=A0A9W4WLD9_9GLOM|nr:14275_t:CDS:1 [Funneliformis geosporum]CAI2162586.1 17844_t:CDS:1 [Funneliformis geosporum]